MVLQWGLVIVQDCQRCRGLDEEIIVDAPMLKIMHDCRPHGCNVLVDVHSP